MVAAAAVAFTPTGNNFIMFLCRGTAFFKHNQQRRGDKDRRVGTDDHSDKQSKRDIGQRSRSQKQRSDDQNGSHREQGNDGGIQRTNHRLVHSQVHHVAIGVAVLIIDSLGKLTNLIENHDGVVK